MGKSEKKYTETCTEKLLYYITPRERSSGGFIGITLSVRLSVRPSVRPSVRLSVQIRVRPITFFFGFTLAYHIWHMDVLP